MNCFVKVFTSLKVPWIMIVIKILGFLWSLQFETSGLDKYKKNTLSDRSCCFHQSLRVDRIATCTELDVHIIHSTTLYKVEFVRPKKAMLAALAVAKASAVSRLILLPSLALVRG